LRLHASGETLNIEKGTGRLEPSGEFGGIRSDQTVEWPAAEGRTPPAQ
jgi:hypothetical protein